MTVNDPPRSNVLPFKRPAHPAPAGKGLAVELKELLHVYDALIALLRETDDDGLDGLTDSIVESVVRCREALANDMDEASGQSLLKEMRAGLREFPRTLRALLPGLGPRLGESIEHKLGIQFAAY